MRPRVMATQRRSEAVSKRPLLPKARPTLLGDAGQMLIQVNIREALSPRDEIELALGCLEGVGDKRSMSPDFWWKLKKAAEVLGLESRYDALRSKRRKAQEIDPS